jgi:hypothetical protein
MTWVFELLIQVSLFPLSGFSVFESGIVRKLI